MRYWTVSLVHEGSVAREWHVWAETLTVGSHGAAKVRLPLPAEPWALRISELPEPQTFQVAEFTLRIADTTAERARLWERAQVRIEVARARAEREADSAPAASSGPSTLQTTMTALCLAGLTHWMGNLLAGTDLEAPKLKVASAQFAVAPAFVEPASPFAACDTCPAVRVGSLASGIAGSKAPSSVRTTVFSVPAPSPDHVSHGSSAGLFATAPEHPPRTALVLASWQERGPEAWESLDQPPPEPPH